MLSERHTCFTSGVTVDYRIPAGLLAIVHCTRGHTKAQANRARHGVVGFPSENGGEPGASNFLFNCRVGVRSDTAPWPVRLLERTTLLCRLRACFVGVGIRPERVNTPDVYK